MSMNLHKVEPKAQFGWVEDELKEKEQRPMTTRDEEEILVLKN